MNYQKKYILIIIFILVLVFGFSYWYFVIRLNTENEIQKTQLTDQQKINILSTVSNVSTQIIPDALKQEILNKKDTNTESIKPFSEKEKLDILNNTK